MTSQLGKSVNNQIQLTYENLCKLQERLAVIDSAQNNIQLLVNQIADGLPSNYWIVALVMNPIFVF